MTTDKLSRNLILFGAIALIVIGLFLIVQTVSTWPGRTARSAPNQSTANLAPSNIATDIKEDAVAVDAAPNTVESAFAAPASPRVDSSPAVAAEPSTPALALSFSADIPQRLIDELGDVQVDGIKIVTGTASAPVHFSVQRSPNSQAVYTVTFAAATRFDTIDPSIAWEALRSLWSGAPVTATETGAAPLFTHIAALTDTLPLLTQVMGEPSGSVVGYGDLSALVEAAWVDRATLAIVPFDRLEPRLVVLAIDGQNPVENSAHFDPARYPLTAPVYVQINAADAEEAALTTQLLSVLPTGNRIAEQLTVLTMTGVTAMCRTTAAQMEKFGPAWPAEVVGPELASADITHISNEVPFVEGCIPNTDPNNFNFCSKPEYMETLWASGVDIVGMTGNHQNDFGRQNAIKSLEMYEGWGIPYYGGGKNLEEAFKPLYIEHNGNRLAFLGANSYGPQMAWATDALPGAAPFDLNILSATIRSIKEKNLADVVLVELQYQESYDAQPLVDQRIDFKALVRAGADIVTGVQSHVPQGIEFADGKLVLYGLGNLYFDQMWAQATREGMVVKHTFYNGRHISTQILTTLLYEYGQPRWTTTQERASILKRVFSASYW